MADDKDKKVGNDSLEGSSSVIEPDKTEPPAPNPPVEDGSLSEPESLAPEQNNFHSSKIAARVMSFANLYFVIFLLLIFLALGGIFAALKLNKDPANCCRQYYFTGHFNCPKGSYGIGYIKLWHALGLAN
jgi:hypothetical protein